MNWWSDNVHDVYSNIHSNATEGFCHVFFFPLQRHQNPSKNRKWNRFSTFLFFVYLLCVFSAAESLTRFCAPPLFSDMKELWNPRVVIRATRTFARSFACPTDSFARSACALPRLDHAWNALRSFASLARSNISLTIAHLIASSWERKENI